ncbi:MAG: FecR family protein [Gammaproteobacteria bacterium]|nr:FecR family protein [Gammaproteobacteria bacterium]
MSKDLDDPRRDFLAKALGLGLFSSPNLVSLLQPAYALGDVPGRLPEGRSIYKLQGSVTVNGKAADISTRIEPNSRIKTGNNSLLIFVVANDAFILRSNSQLEMESGDGLIIDAFRMLSGRLLSVFGKRKKPHTITTSTATIGIRGTGMYFESDPEKSYICTCYGHSHIVANANPDISLDVITEYHDKPYYVLSTATSGDKLIVPAPVINHTDSELTLIEELVGRTPPFENLDSGYGVSDRYN